MESVLTNLRGTKTAKFVKLLASLDGFGAMDTVIKQKLMSEGTLAPFVASISKACKRSKVKMASVLLRKEKKIRPGKVLYHYRLTKEAAAFVNSLADLDTYDEYVPTRAIKESEAHEPEHDSIQANGDVSNRAKVRQAAKSKSAADISNETGLSKSQVRAVLNAPRETNNYEKKALSDGSYLYTYTGYKN